MNASVIATRENSGTVVLTLDNPQRRNALSLSLMRELSDGLDGIAADATVRALILASTGPVFSSGHDLNEIIDHAEETLQTLFSVCVDLMLKLQQLPFPVIAEVQGPAFAAGCQLVASCDLAIASDKATFATPGARIGLFCTTPMVALSRSIGQKRALEMLYTGKVIDASTAERWGLVNGVVAHSDLRGATLELARQIEEVSPAAIRSGKESYRREFGLPYRDAYEHARESMVRDAQAADASEGIRAFLGKKRPEWTRSSSKGNHDVGKGVRPQLLDF